MHPTLVFIPHEIAGIPTFGFGLLLAVWALGSVALLAWLGWRQGFTADTWAYVPLLALVGVVIAWLLPALCESRGLPIRSYGMMMLAAIVSATALAAWRAHRRGLDPELSVSLAFWMCVPGIVGARVFYVIEYWPEQYWPVYEEHGLGAILAAVINVTQGGLVVYGSLIGAVLGLLAFVRKNRLPLLAVCDLVAPSMLLGLALGRIGCLLNGCCFGGLSELPWAITFPADSPVHFYQVEHGQTFIHGLRIDGNSKGQPVIAEVKPGSPAAEQKGLKPQQVISKINGLPVFTAKGAAGALLNANKISPTTDEIIVATEEGRTVGRWTIEGSPGGDRPVRPVHPTQVYSTINALLLCLLLLAYDPFCRRDGQVFALMLTIYPITRFLLEMIRTDESAVFGTSMSISQNASLLVLLCIAVLWFAVLRRPPERAFD